MIRTCNRCKRKTRCRLNHTCKNGVEALCVKCNRQQAAEWYGLNRERKVEYQRQYRLKNKEA